MRESTVGRAPRVAVLFVLAVVVAALVPTTAGAAGRSEDDPRVLVVTLPRLTWERLADADTPTIDAFLDGAAVASMSTRTVGARTSPGAAYTSIGAGNRARTIGLQDGGQVLMATETADGGSAAELYQRRTGIVPDGRLLAVDFPEIVEGNDQLRYGSVPGSLGAALADDGIGVGAVGNADDDPNEADGRQVGLAVVDAEGQALHGEVGSSLLVADPLAPAGRRFDPATVATAVQRAWDDGARVLFVEMSDLERAEQARVESTPSQGDAQYVAALEAADTLLATLLSQVDLGVDTVMLLGPTGPLDREQLTVFAAAGPGLVPGWATSSSTRRDGYVSLSDIAATVLHAVAVEVPSAAGDSPVVDEPDTGTPAADRVDALVTANERALFRDAAVGPLTVAFIALVVLLLLAVAVAVALDSRWLSRLPLLALVVMAVPPATYLGGLLPYGGFSVVTYGLSLLAIAVVVAVVCHLVGRGDPLGPPLCVAAFTVALLVVDVATGARLQINTIFGYSPIVAGRFAGFGNQAFSLVALGTLLVATAGWELLEVRRPQAIRMRLPMLLALFVVVVAVVGAPAWGSDVGGVLASVPAFAVCTLLLLDRRVRVRTVATIAAATVAALAVFAALDLARPAESRTHLGRFAAGLADGEAGLILSRKLNANLSVLTSTVWTWVIPAALLFLVYLTWRPNNQLIRINAEHPRFRAFGVAAITLGLVAWGLNDSGVSMPALMLTVALPYTAVLAIDVRRRAEPGRAEPGRAAPRGAADREPAAGGVS